MTSAARDALILSHRRKPERPACNPCGCSVRPGSATPSRRA